ncbi:heavy metal response regulator transcription factor [Psychrobacter celer]|jgi:two-component system copper resistance phosphate regulon response regulator CusR|uniref:DNA-binding response regulator n=3 Tax=Psychrobacter TaxID=497 RepID=A0A1G6V7X7_9GAMM|nr:MULTISPECIES: heavy metal response regulator transcription factor [Psychrobacter]MED6317559.1 heavy metal response regulator transcription factor [Pseudomonadota bacterium]AOY43060.1 transcriptional regulatory protein YedW [Psychrobacter sp. AntiMn-1]MBZ1392930.1 heavy metal response regulator transcription factor [Psychrobacter pacificensis]MCD1280534.1 DNA-binding response regulator [Psychrobacter sp. CCUG 69069]MDH4905055.1 DNA-binding response regulator [Psychrobacter pocilloporae]|tara:strand:- start:1794 stop:2528 length:735 start_codon:yes stop_codon:yes gene_type:complete
MKVLLVEDELKLGEYVKKGLSEAGFIVDHQLTGLDGYHAMMTEEFSVILMDVMLPDVSGFELVRNYRAAGKHTPVLFLTAKDDLDDKIKGIEIGGDDYLTKPFAFAELIVRIKSLLRRANQADYKSTLMQIADLKMDIAKRTVHRGDTPIKLTAKEFSLLQFLLERRGEVLPRSIIASQVWDMNFDNDTNVIDVAIRRLRIKIDDEFDTKLIHTVRGMGYRLDAVDVSASNKAASETEDSQYDK